MIEFLKWLFTFIFGTDKNKRFTRLIIFIITVGIISMLIINVGYEKSKGGLYWKPADISIKKGVKNDDN